MVKHRQNTNYSKIYIQIYADSQVIALNYEGLDAIAEWIYARWRQLSIRASLCKSPKIGIIATLSCARY